MSEKTKQKLRISNIGRPQSRESNEKRSKTISGTKRSEETKRKHRERIASEETRLKMSMSAMGHTVSEESRRKTSEGNKGKIVSEETKKKQSVRMSGTGNPMFNKHHTEESLIKMRKPKTEEHKRHMSESRKQLFELRRKTQKESTE